MARKSENTSRNSAGTIPDKKTMNFVQREPSIRIKKLLPVILIIILFGVLFAKFGILDLLEQKADAYQELSEKHQQLELIHVRLADYPDLEKEYGRYSYAWMSESEIQMVNRMEVLQLVEGKISTRAFIDDLALNQNVLTMNIHGITLEEASAMVGDLEKHSLVQSVSLYQVVAGNAQDARIFLSIILTKEAG